MTIETDGLGDEPDFDSVFTRDDDVTDSRDSGVDTAAPGAAQPRDETGRFMSVHNTPVEEAAPQPQEAKDPPQQQEQPAPQAETPPGQPQDRMIPLQELRSERQKRQDAERQLAELRGQVSAFERMQQQRPQQPQPQAQQEQVPDPYADPEGFARYQNQRQHVQFREQIANMSEAIARRQFGPDLVDKATQWAIQNNVAQHFFHSARDPYGELVETFQRQEALSRIGNDPDSYERRIREEERNKVLEELKAGGVNGGQPKPTFPGSLASATPTGRQGGHLDPQTAADSVFARG